MDFLGSAYRYTALEACSSRATRGLCSITRATHSFLDGHEQYMCAAMCVNVSFIEYDALTFFYKCSMRF